jgi:MFS family permease
VAGFFDEKSFAVWVLDFVFAFFLGIVFQYFAIVPVCGLSIRKGILAALKADTLSLAAWQIGMYALMAIVQFFLYMQFFGHISQVETPEFWFAMQLAMVAGFTTAYAVNGWLIRVGIKERMQGFPPAWASPQRPRQPARSDAGVVRSPRSGKIRLMKKSPGILRQIPTGIWVLGLVSMLMDISSEMIHGLLPLFMVTVLGATASTVGLIEGLAESTALIVKVFSGTLSDWLGRRKELAVLGYALGALSKPLFAIASTMGIVLGARLIDRVGKGIRGAPRDALVADIAPAHLRGAAFGLRQSLDTVGAFLGPLLAVCLMLLWANDFRRVFWVAVIPGVLAVALLLLALREPPRTDSAARVNPLRREHLRRLGPKYWWVVGIGTVFTLARFSEAFLVLRSQRAGVPIALVPLVMVAMNLVYAASAYPFGKLSDRMSHVRLLTFGIVVLIAADLVLAIDGHWAVVLIGVLLWGVHMGMTQGLLAAMVAETSPADLRGTAFGFFNLASGVAMLVASGVAGIIWDAFGPPATFLAGAFFCFLALSVLALRRFRTKS